MNDQKKPVHWSLDFNDAPMQDDFEGSSFHPDWADYNPNDRREEHLSAQQVKDDLLGDLLGVLGWLYPNGFVERPGERRFRIGDVYGAEGQSVSVALSGEKKGCWYDFSTGEGGDILDLWRLAKGLGSFGATIKDIASQSGRQQPPSKSIPRRAAKGIDFDVPPTATYHYRDTTGALVAVVERYEKDGKKTFLPWDPKAGRHRMPSPRPLYRLESLKSATVVLVEGEKCVDALATREVFATTAMGGSKAPIAKTDWSPLTGRDVIIWPDADEPGRAYAQAVAKHLQNVAKSVRILDVSERPEGWDAADAVEAGENVLEIIRGKGRPINLQSAWAFAADFIPPDFLVDRVVQRRYAYTLTGRAGAGKTTLAMLLSTCVATGRPFGPYETDKGRVCFLAGENPDDVRARLIIAGEHYGIGLDGLDLHFVSGRFDMAADMKAVAEAAHNLGGFDLVIVDTVAAYFTGDDENDNRQMIEFSKLLRRLTELPGGPAVIALAHPTKGATRDSLMPRGGYGMVGEMDGNLTLWEVEDKVVELYFAEKIRGPGFDPIQFEIRGCKSERVTDAKGRKIASGLVFPISDEVAEERSNKARSNEDEVLENVLSFGSMSLRERGDMMGWPKSTLERVINKLVENGLLYKDRGRDVKLTNQGRKEAERLTMKGSRADG